VKNNKELECRDLRACLRKAGGRILRSHGLVGAHFHRKRNLIKGVTNVSAKRGIQRKEQEAVSNFLSRCQDVVVLDLENNTIWIRP
jgi:hypothetical protein